MYNQKYCINENVQNPQIVKFNFELYYSFSANTYELRKIQEYTTGTGI